MSRKARKIWLMFIVATVFGAVHYALFVAHIFTALIGQTLGWIVNLIVAEVLIRRRRARSALFPAQ